MKLVCTVDDGVPSLEGVLGLRYLPPPAVVTGRLLTSPPAVETLPQSDELLTLWCGHGSLRWLPVYPRLRVLRCEGNQLTALPSYPCLENLWCQGNQITSLETCLQLGSLRCQDNQLTTLPEFPRLTTLDARNNPIVELPYYPMLKRIDLRGTPMAARMKDPTNVVIYHKLYHKDREYFEKLDWLSYPRGHKLRRALGLID